MVLVFGSVNVDFVMRAPALPAPGETVLGGSYLIAPGGKGANQACAAARAGAPTALVACVGDDAWGRLVLEGLVAAGVDLDAVAMRTTPTGCASILVDAYGENAIAVASGANLDLRAAHLPSGLLGPGVTVVLQMEVASVETFAVAERAAKAGARVVLNVAPAAPVPAGVLDAVDVLVVNAVEAQMVADTLGLAHDGPQCLAAALSCAHRLACVVTLGAAGIVAADSESVHTLEALAVEVVDTTGAGDAFTGVLAGSLDAGHAFADALRRAGVAGALACTAPGAQAAYPDGAGIDDALVRAPEVVTVRSGRRAENPPPGR